MKKYIFSISALLSLGTLSAQVRTVNSATNVSVTNSPAFIDASSNTTVNGSSNIGKGLIFPRVDLSAMTAFPSVTAGIPNSFPTRFDGMIVYNTAASGTAGVGSTQGALSPGYWYYENKSSSNTGGTWKPVSTATATVANTASNGLTLSGNDVKLGGPLNQATTVTNNGNALNIAGSGSTSTFASNGYVGVGTTTPTSMLQTNGSFATRYVALSTDTTLDGTYHTVNAVHNSGTVTLTLPSVTGVTGRQYVVQNNGTGTTNVVVSGGGTIEGQTTFTLNQVGQTAQLIAGNSEWQLVTNAIKSPSVPSGANIYTADGTLNSNRNLNLNDKNLNFNATTGIINFNTNTNNASTLNISNNNGGSNAYSGITLNNGGNSTYLFQNSSTRSLDGGANTTTLRNDAGALKLSGNAGNSMLSISSFDGLAYFYNNILRMQIDGTGNYSSYNSLGSFVNSASGPLTLKGNNGAAEMVLSTVNGGEFYYGGTQRLQFDGSGNINQYGPTGNFIKAASGPLTLQGNNGGSQIVISTTNGGEFYFGGAQRLQIDGSGNINQYSPTGNFINSTSGPLSLRGDNGNSQFNLSTLNGFEYYYSGTKRLQFDGSGNVISSGGVFRNDGGAAFLSGNAGYAQIEVGTTNGLKYYYNGSMKIQFDGAGSIYANAFINTSDARLKSNIKNIKYGLKEIMKLSPKSYDMLQTREIKNGIPVINNTTKKTNSIGFLAQDIYEIIPETVNKPKDDQNEIWGVDYTKLVPILTKAIQEQQAQIEQLKTENKELKAQVEAIKKKLGM